MIKPILIFLILVTVPLFSQSVSVTQIDYSKSNTIFSNPERGFSSYQDSKITPSLVHSLRNQQVSVIQRIYTIPQYNNSALSENFLQLVQDDLDAAREGGAKLVLRFSYTDDQNGADAPLDTILKQIEQLKPILQKNYDVIAFMDAGFIGAWGEWYYSSHHLNNTADRRTVLFALLDALPNQRCVVVRTPNYKRLIFEDNNPLTPEEAFSGTKKARTGAHNDCFLASNTDYGTYLDNNIEGDKNFLNQDNRYVPQSGETCSPSAYSGCTNALKDLERMHWSVLNKDYNTDVLNGWVSGGCMDEIKRRLGYRFVLKQAVIPDSLKPGSLFHLEFDIKNVGFASPYNGRLLEIVLGNLQDGKTWRLLSDEGPRFWGSGDSLTVSIDGGLPADMPEGAYETLLHLADPVDTLRYRPEYAIRLANENVWEDSTGFNNLQHSIVINKQAAGEDYSGENVFKYFQTQSTPPPPQTKIKIDGSFDDWQNVPQLDIAPDEEQAGDALNSAVDIVDIWATNDADNLYISYKLAGNHNDSYFYHVFMDVDHDSSTGFHSAGSHAGIDIMIENTSLWLYSGANGEWGWTAGGAPVQAWGTQDPSRVELAIDRTLLIEQGSGNAINLIFNVNELDDTNPDDYAPDNYTEHSYSYTFSTTAIENNYFHQLPKTIQLSIYPNPFNNRVKIKINAAHLAGLHGAIYDVRGRLIKSFYSEEIQSGLVSWDGTNQKNNSVGSGLYIIRIYNKNIVEQTKVVLLK